jgi:hypothetical protein
VVPRKVLGNRGLLSFGTDGDPLDYSPKQFPLLGHKIGAVSTEAVRPAKEFLKLWRGGPSWDGLRAGSDEAINDCLDTVGEALDSNETRFADLIYNIFGQVRQSLANPFVEPREFLASDRSTYYLNQRLR